MDAMVKRPMINGVRMQILGRRAEPTEGALCVSAYFLLFSSRKQSEDEFTVSSRVYAASCTVLRKLMCHTGAAHLNWSGGKS